MQGELIPQHFLGRQQRVSDTPADNSHPTGTLSPELVAAVCKDRAFHPSGSAVGKLPCCRSSFSNPHWLRQ